jgi:hypothetical protein
VDSCKTLLFTREYHLLRRHYPDINGHFRISVIHPEADHICGILTFHHQVHPGECP